MENIEIGIAEMHYNEDGSMNTVLTHFTPTLKVTVDRALTNRLMKIKRDNSASAIKNNADMVLGSWFNQMTQFELADRDQYEIASEVIEDQCEEYIDGSIKRCSLRYFFSKIGA